MKHIPMIFQGWEVRAILEDRKARTRRIVKPQPEAIGAVKFTEWAYAAWGTSEFLYTSNSGKVGIFHPHSILCPYPKGARPWVRETFAVLNVPDGNIFKIETVYKATDWKGWLEYEVKSIKWKPSIFMKREYSRIVLIVTKDRPPERLQDITPHDAHLEGWPGMETTGLYPQVWFKQAWNSINAKPAAKKRNGVITHYESYPWSEQGRDPREAINGKHHFCYPNPWVFPIEFERIKP